MASTDRRIRTQKIGMSQEEALVSLQREASANEEFITSFARQGNHWVATLRHIAEFPPSADDEGGDDEAPEKPAGEEDGSGEPSPAEKSEGGDSEGGDSPFPPKGDGEKKDSEGGPKPPHGEHGGKPGGDAVEHQILTLLKQIADGMGIGGAEPKMAPGVGPDVPPPPGPPKPPAGGPPAGPGAGGPPMGPGKGQPYGTKLKPGEVPNRPGVVPVGAPSFASVKQADVNDFSWSPQPATTTPTTSAPPNVTPAGNPGVVSSPPCSKCGGPTQGGICAQCAQAAGGVQSPGGPAMQPMAGANEFHVESGVPMTPVEAHRELTAAYQSQGYKVARITQLENGGVHATLVRV